MFTGKGYVVSDSLKDRAEQKIRRLERLFPKNVEISVTFSSVKQDNKIEVSVPLNRRTLRAEVSTNDMYNSIDEVVDVLEKQMVKYKTRLKNKSRKDSSYREELAMVFTDSDDAMSEDHEIIIERNKNFEIKPMDPEDAVMEMELLGHSFFVFRNGRTDKVNVVYRRASGTYGLIEPKY